MVSLHNCQRVWQLVRQEWLAASLFDQLDLPIRTRLICGCGEMTCRGTHLFAQGSRPDNHSLRDTADRTSFTILVEDNFDGEFGLALCSLYPLPHRIPHIVQQIWYQVEYF